MAKFWLTALPVVLAASGAAGAEAPVRCMVQAVPAAGAVQLRAVALAREALEGEYVFTVDKRGGGGTASSAQSGAFRLAPGGEEVLADVTLGREQGARWSARLTVLWPDGSAECAVTDEGL